MLLLLVACGPAVFDFGGGEVVFEVDSGGDAVDTQLDCGPELCNGMDDDCDGVVDEPDAEDASQWFPDNDGDGFGGPNAVFGCEPSGYVDVTGDCDDGAASVHPGADEQCNGVDDDCDGVVDGAHCQSHPIQDEAVWRIDGPAAQASLRGPVVFGPTMAVGAWRAEQVGLFDGSLSGATPFSDGLVVVEGDEAGDAFGSALAWLDEHVAAGGPGADEGSGAVWLLDVEFAAGHVLLEEVEETRIEGDDGDGVGTSLLGPDLDGTGEGDLLVGAPGLTRILRFRSATLTVDELEAADADDTMSGPDGLGTAMASIGDVDGDGRDDVAVAAGSAYLVTSWGTQLSDVAEGRIDVDAAIGSIHVTDLGGNSLVVGRVGAPPCVVPLPLEGVVDDACPTQASVQGSAVAVDGQALWIGDGAADQLTWWTLDAQTTWNGDNENLGAEVYESAAGAVVAAPSASHSFAGAGSLYGLTTP